MYRIGPRPYETTFRKRDIDENVRMDQITSNTDTGHYKFRYRPDVYTYYVRNCVGETLSFRPP